MRTIEVDGNSTLYIESDLMELNLELIYEDPRYHIANEALKEDHLTLIQILNDLGFESSLLKTTGNQIQVLPAYDDKVKRFKVSQKFIYCDALDMDKLSKFLDEIKIDDSINFSLAYYSSQIESYEKDALVSALKDAKKKAKIIAQAAQVELGELVSFKENRTDHPSLLRASFSDTMPDDIKLHQQITAVYSIN